MPKLKIEPPKIPKAGKGTPPNDVSTNLVKPNDGQLVPLHFAVPIEFRREYKTFAAEHDISMVQLLQRSFELYKQSLK